MHIRVNPACKCFITESQTCMCAVLCACTSLMSPSSPHFFICLFPLNHIRLYSLHPPSSRSNPSRPLMLYYYYYYYYYRLVFSNLLAFCFLCLCVSFCAFCSQIPANAGWTNVSAITNGGVLETPLNGTMIANQPGMGAAGYPTHW